MCAALICGAPGTGKSHCGEEVLFRLGRASRGGTCMDKVTCRSAAAVKSGLIQLGRRMGRTLGIGPDSTGEDVLDALRKHMASSPCVPVCNVSCRLIHCVPQVRDYAGRCLRAGSGRSSEAAARQLRGQRFTCHVAVDQEGGRFPSHTCVEVGRRCCEGHCLLMRHSGSCQCPAAVRRVWVQV
jgi:hypothetical protein